MHVSSRAPHLSYLDDEKVCRLWGSILTTTPCFNKFHATVVGAVPSLARVHEIPRSLPESPLLGFSPPWFDPVVGNVLQRSLCLIVSS